jgi:hypothetical protein
MHLTASAPAASHSSLAEDFRRDGCAGPFRVCAPTDCAALQAAYFAAAGVDPAAWSPASAKLSAWHHHQRWAYELATSPAILDRVEEILGPDLVLWAMFAWYKEPRTEKRIPWHQDASYWPLEPKLNVTAWLALDHCDPDNGCLRVIPGTHRAAIDHVAVDDTTSWFNKGADPAAVDERQARDLVLQPGEFVLFNEGTLHGSEPNRSARPRLALSLRYTTPEVRLHGDKWGDDRVRAFQVRGRDRFGYNDAWRGVPPA